MFDREYRMNRLSERCSQYGFSPGTTAFAQCLQNEELHWRGLMVK